MQRQKTIAKWLSIVLLTTIAIASYVLLSTTSKSGQSTSAVAGAGNEKKSDIINAPIVYSTLPRNAETVNNIKVAHVGGSGQETLLGHANFCGKTLLFFSTNSQDRDVKESGLYIAVFDKNQTLEKTIKIGGESSQYLCSANLKNGLIVFVKNEVQTDVFLLGETLTVSAKTSLKRYDFILPISNAIGEFLCYDGEYMQALKIDDTLCAATDNFLYQSANLKVVDAFKIGTETLVFAQDGQDARFISYSHNNGFICAYSQDKATILQILPIAASGNQTFVTLLKTSSGLTLKSFDTALNLLQSRDIPAHRNGVVLTNDTGIEVLAGASSYRYCPHLDYLGKQDVKCNENFDDSAFLSEVKGGGNIFVAKRKNGFVLCEKSGDEIKTIFACDSASLPSVKVIKNADNSHSFCMFFVCDASNEFSYMCFGNSDLFYLSLTTSKS